jgi:hypothetical protein
MDATNVASAMASATQRPALMPPVAEQQHENAARDSEPGQERKKRNPCMFARCC